MIATKQLIDAMERGASALRALADEGERDLEDQPPGSQSAKLIQIAIEEHRQAADLLAGCAARAKAKK